MSIDENTLCYLLDLVASGVDPTMATDETKVEEEKWVLCWRQKDWKEGAFSISNKNWTAGTIGPIVDLNERDYPDVEFWAETRKDAVAALRKPKPDIAGYLEWADEIMKEPKNHPTNFRAEVIALRKKFHGVEKYIEETETNKIKKLEETVESLQKQVDHWKEVCDDRDREMARLRRTIKDTEKSQPGEKVKGKARIVQQPIKEETPGMLGKLDRMDKSEFKVKIWNDFYLGEGIAETTLSNDDRSEDFLRERLLELQSHIRPADLEKGNHEIIYYLDDGTMFFKLVKKSD